MSRCRYADLRPDERAETYSKEQQATLRKMAIMAREFAAHYLIRVDHPENGVIPCDMAFDKLLEAAEDYALAFNAPVVPDR